jgi:methionyl aminopeptidase
MIILKTQAEIVLMREAGLINQACHMEIEKHIHEGVTTWELDRIAEEFIIKQGGKPAFKGYHGYPATINASINEEVVHGIPNKNRKLKKGDIIGIDLGTIWKGYYADSANTWAVGEISPDTAKLMKVTKECLYIGISKCMEGNRVSDISAAVQNHAESNGFSVVRDLVGHGIGRKMHEDPKVPNFVEKRRRDIDHKLKSGMVIAIEPMINMGSYSVEILEDDWTVVTADRRPSAHYEHTVAITRNGPMILTASEGQERFDIKEFSAIIGNKR